MAVVQFYFSLSVLTYGEAYWQHRGRAAYVTAGLTTLIAFLVWMFAGLYYVLMLE